MHANFSNTTLRHVVSRSIEKICEAFRPVAQEQLKSMVSSMMRDLLAHETASINDFSYGVSDRGASIRIPIMTVENGWKGWLKIEDLRQTEILTRLRREL